MCFSSMPKVPKAQTQNIPTERSATVDGLKKRQLASADAKANDTVATSPLGDQSTASTFKSTLGG